MTRSVDIEGYPMRRDMRLSFVQDNGETKIRIESPYCDANFKYDPHPRMDLMANCEIFDYFLADLKSRVLLMIDALEKMRENRSAAIGEWSEKQGRSLTSGDLSDREEAFAREGKFLERMDMLFDDAEKFVSMVDRKGNVFGYCVFVNDEKEDTAPLMLAYMGDECVASLELDSPEKMDTGREFARLCRLGTKEKGNIRCHNLIAKMTPASGFDGLSVSWTLRPVEHELAKEELFFKPVKKHFDESEDFSSSPSM